MRVFVLSKSDSYKQHLQKVLDDNKIKFLSSISNFSSTKEILPILIHAASYRGEIETILTKLRDLPVSAIGVAADKPFLKEMLSLNNFGVQAYFNSYMAKTHYQQMIQHISSGQTWYLPGLLESALRIANEVITPQEKPPLALDGSTQREKEIISRIAVGMSNKEIANQLHITLSAVKARLTKIFKKYGVSDRVSLAILVNAAQNIKH